MEQNHNDKPRSHNLHDRAERLSKASERKYIHPESPEESDGIYPYKPKSIEYIDWDLPEYEVRDDDPRWILPEDFDLGVHPWYQELPELERIRVGKYRYAQIARIGSEFEAALISGASVGIQALPSGSMVRRYALHESREEHQHMLMFDEFVKRTGSEPKGAPNWFRTISHLASPVAKISPVVFWALVLTGEEPIDRLQRDMIDKGRKGEVELHPMMERVMKVHVEEEARHIGFADTFLEDNIKKMNRVERDLFATLLPVATKVFADLIVRPSKEALEDMGVPDDVADEVWFDSDSGRAMYSTLFERARNRADKLGLRDGENKHRLGKIAWELTGLNDSAFHKTSPTARLKNIGSVVYRNLRQSA